MSWGHEENLVPNKERRGMNPATQLGLTSANFNL